MRKTIIAIVICLLAVLETTITDAAFTTSSTGGQQSSIQTPSFCNGMDQRITSNSKRSTTTQLQMATISESEAKKYIDKVVSTLRRDKSANTELGKLTKINNILGYGSPRPNTIAVRFNASFQKGGRGMSAVPLPFGMGQSNKSEGRGTMVGQVKASVDAKSGKVLECSVFRDLGYGRAFNLKV